MQEQEPQSKGTVRSSNKNVVPRKIIYAVVILFVLILPLTSYLTYSWQHRKVTWQLKQTVSSQAQLAAAKATISKDQSSLQEDAKQLTNETQKNAAINQQYQALLNTQQQAPPTQTDLQMSVGTATTYSNGCCAQVGIVVTLKNTTSSSILVEPDAYKLKDADNHTFNYDINLLSYFLGSGFTPLQSQSLAPGETVTGALGYDIPDKTVTSYTLVLGTNSYDVAATQK